MCRWRIPVFALLTACEISLLSCNEQSVSTKEPASVSAVEYLSDSIAEQQTADSIALEHSRLLAVPSSPKNTLQFYDHNGRYPCMIANPDTMIHKVILCDINSSVNVLGYDWELIEDNIDMPHQNYSNAQGSQFLRCFFHYGGGKYGYSEFEVALSCKEPKVKAFADEEFVSGNGIRLGMHKDSVIAITGNCYLNDTAGGNVVIRYIADDYLHNQFLQEWNYPKYYAEYEFKEDKLVRFRFGFEYP